MPKYQLLSCQIRLAGDVGNVVVRSAFRPISYPELIVLNVLHGETAISHILDCGETEERHRDEEYRRLADIYGDQIMKTLFPGHAINLPERNERIPKDAVRTPVSQDTEQDEIDPKIAESVAAQSQRAQNALQTRMAKT